MSSAIELTQYTGIWGLYRCAYRYFDIGDLIANPAGALIGSIAAAVVFGRTPEPRPTVAPQLTAGRRIAAFTSDVIIVVVVSAATVVTWRAWLLIGRHVAVDDIDPGTQALVQWGVPFAFQAVAVLGWGRTLGEAAVQIRTRPRRRGWTFPGRLMKLASGIGVLTLLGAAIVPGSGWMLLGLLAAHLVAAAFTGGRGLSNFVSGLDVELTVPPDSSTET